jgi:hypothetical protein
VLFFILSAMAPVTVVAGVVTTMYALNGRVLGVLLSAEVAVLLVLSLAGLGDPASGLPLTSLSPGGLFGHPGLGALLVTALLGYVGFEATARSPPWPPSRARAGCSRWPAR